MTLHFLQLNLKAINKLFLNLIVCGLGYTLWSTLSTFSMISLVKRVPVLMIDTGKEIKYHSSHAEATITIQGSRSAMKWCDIEELAIHINPEELHQERNAIAITEKHLFLPPTIQVVHSEPHVITITLNEKLT